MTAADKAQVHVEVVRGSPRFANACRAAAVSLGMLACAQASAGIDAPLKNIAPQPLASASAAPGTTLLDIAPTAAAIQAQRLLTDQSKPAESITPEQNKVLQYGIYPPVKTTLKIDGKLETHWTLHPFDVVRLAREAAAKASLTEGIKVDPAKVGAVMIAESSMVSRVGWSANGKTPSFGLAQLEENTARSLGVKDLTDPRESALAAAKLVAEGQRLVLANKGVPPDLVASLAYNCSTRLRTELINGFGAKLRLDNLPQATQAHVINMAYGEQRMHQFEKLSDQHDKLSRLMAQTGLHVSTQTPQIAKSALASANLNQLPSSAFVSTKALVAAKTLIPNQESIVIPRPSTMSLVTNFATDGANQVRLKYNQLALEKSGHLQVLPMTTQGINDLRRAISVNIQRLSNSGNPADRSRDLDHAPAALLLSTIGENLEHVARSFLEKARGAYEQVVIQMREAMKMPSPTPPQTAQALEHDKSCTTAHLHRCHSDRLEREERLAAMRAHPAYVNDADSLG